MPEDSEQDEALDRAEVEGRERKVRMYLIRNSDTLLTADKITDEVDGVDKGDVTTSQSLEFPKPHYRVRTRSVGGRYYYYAELDKAMLFFLALIVALAILFIVLGYLGML